MLQQNRPLFGVLLLAIPRGQKPGAGWRQLEQFTHAAGLRACWFSIRDVDLQHNRVDAWICKRSANGVRTWQKTRLRLPDVVYDNVPVPTRNREDVMRIKRHLRQKGIPYFNPPLGTKPQLGKWLQSYPALYQHHPETLFQPSCTDVPALLKRHRAVYLKPFLGRGGIGILEISQLKTPNANANANAATYQVRSSLYGAQGKELHKQMTHAELLSFLQNEFRRTRYFLQAGCDLMHIDRCKIDIRAHMQRDRQGRWQCVGLVVKQGKANAIVSNYHLGGALHTWAWLQQRTQAQQIPLPTEQQVIVLAQKIATAYAAKAPHLGCLGFDLGIDTRGRIWLLDINSPPSRSLLPPAGRRRSLQLIAEFASYLARKK